MALTAPDGRWLPAQIRAGEVTWLRADGVRPTEPFFAETVDRLRRRPFNRLLARRTGLTELGARSPAGLPIRGLVAHTSRCGSTLVAGWLAADPQHCVLSEPQPLDVVLRLDLPVDEHVSLIQSLLAALAQPRAGSEVAGWVKLDAWAIRSLPLLQLALPGVPVVLLTRNPLEAAASHLGHRGAHTIPGALGEVAGATPEEQVSRVLGDLHRDVLALTDPPGLIVDHADLESRRGEVLSVLGADPSYAGLDAVSARHAKNPVLPWVDDSASRRAGASPALRAAVAEHAEPAYRQVLASVPA